MNGKQIDALISVEFLGGCSADVRKIIAMETAAKDRVSNLLTFLPMKICGSLSHISPKRSDRLII
ncbi:hypothetical protein DPMN_045387 [Dreissena polymorpha]|uniref:Uncharacterized protein n=1 Tax=Dreissena polymorpha TaxID=45954 RepID=A0A9D4HZL5_DREPO|nr:hypothetical protein DPMN_045387 [Dreissena polymorpha]